ncbi:heavy metal-associated isoprenylated plant protein 3-like [Syzygium oleosum]|uniref:heavy metal-associated isoprenylated plant protein 3-like n=1 Tax=Syzygium oleosum TaxID=219896 RepID=UPI0024B96B2B|nr:heavy metal-associated isoprenylated plant protein 3-like [Syzygium oleosum]
MVIRYKEFCFDVDESGLVCTGNRQADEQLTGKSGKGSAPSSSTVKERKKFQIFSRDKGGGVSKVEKVAAGNEGTNDVKVENVAEKSGVKDLEWESVKLKERFQEQQEHKSEKCDQLVSPARLKSNHGTRDIYIDSIPRKSPLITGDKGNLKERNEKDRTNRFVVSSPQGGGNAILYAKESLYSRKKNETKRSSTLVLRIRLHCDDCIRKIQKYILKYKGVESVVIDASKDQVSVTGVVEMKELVPYLKDKIRRNVEVIPTTKGGDEEIKDKVNTGGLGGDEDYGKKEEQTPLTKNVNQRDNHWSLPHPITHSNDGEIHNWNYGTEAYQGYMNQGAAYQRFNQSYASDIFSDENPNACSIM